MMREKRVWIIAGLALVMLAAVTLAYISWAGEERPTLLYFRADL